MKTRPDISEHFLTGTYRIKSNKRRHKRVGYSINIYYATVCMPGYKKQQKTSVYDQKISQSHRRPTNGIVRKSRTPFTGHTIDKQGKATSSYFPIKMIVKLERSQNDA